MDQREVLVLIHDPDRQGQVLGRLEAVGHVTQRLPPRLALVELRGATSSPPSVAGTTWFVDDPPPEAVLTEMAPAERAFIAGWNERRLPKSRPHDQLDWGAEGLEPPDNP